MRRTLLAVTLLILATTVAADEGDLSLRIYDISSISAPRIPRVGPRLGSTPSQYVEPEAEEFEPRAFLEPDQVAELIREHVAPDSWGEEGIFIDVRRSRLYVRNQVHLLDKVKGMLDAMTLAASRRVRFDVAVYRMEWESGIALVAGKPFVPGENAERLESGSVETYPGVATTFKITNRLRLLKDFDVEIAENSAIADPIVEAADEGFVIDLVPHPTMDGGKVVVEALVRHGTFERPIPRLKLSENRKTLLGVLDLPVFRQAYAHLTAVVSSGGEFTVPFVTEGGLIVVRVSKTPGAHG